MSEKEELGAPSYPHYRYVATVTVAPQRDAVMSLDRAYVHTLSGSSRGSHHTTPFEISGVSVQGKKFQLREPVMYFCLLDLFIKNDNISLNILSLDI